jgi:hypothetical protein
MIAAYYGPDYEGPIPQQGPLQGLDAHEQVVALDRIAASGDLAEVVTANAAAVQLSFAYWVRGDFTFQRQKAHPCRAGDECRLARRRACSVLYWLLAPCQLHDVCRFQAQSFAWEKHQRALDVVLVRHARVAQSPSLVLKETNLIAVGQPSSGARP